MSIKRILVVEDSQERINHFYRLFPPDVLAICHTGSKAILAMKAVEFDCIFLCYKSSLDFISTPGLDAANWLAKNPECQKDAKIVIHSMSPAGRTWISDTIGRDSIQIPFATFDHSTAMREIRQAVASE